MAVCGEKPMAVDMIVQRFGAPESCELRAFGEVQESLVFISPFGRRLRVHRAMIDSKVWVALVACTASSIRMPDTRRRPVSSTITAPASSRSPHAPKRSRSIPDVPTNRPATPMG